MTITQLLPKEGDVPYQPDPALVRECATRIIRSEIDAIRDLGAMDIGEMCEDEIEALHATGMTTGEAYKASDVLIAAVLEDIKAAVISHAWPETVPAESAPLVCGFELDDGSIAYYGVDGAR
jgi:hypothetical protein